MRSDALLRLVSTWPVFAWMAGSQAGHDGKVEEMSAPLSSRSHHPSVMPALEAGIHANATDLVFAWMTARLNELTALS